MNESTGIGGPPRRILLATDLSVRGDRALDRAVILAARWNAELFVLHVLEPPAPSVSDLMDPPPSWKRQPDLLAVARQRVISELGDIGRKATILVEEGEPADTIACTAEKQNCDLIVIGVARNEFLGQFDMGRTVDHLLRLSRVPLLIVKKRAKRPYDHIVVATDFSAASRHALNETNRLFPTERLIVFHAYDPPKTSPLTESGTYRREYRKVAVQDCDNFLQESDLSPTARERLDVLVEYGLPNYLLHDYVVDRNIDLVALGTHGRSAVLSALIGSVAKRILADSPSDILLVQQSSSGD